MLHYVYVLESKTDQNHYVGCTTDIKKRLEQHNQGKNFSTSHRRPFSLIYCEVFRNQTDAYSREKFLKTGWGRRFLSKILKNYNHSKKFGG